MGTEVAHVTRDSDTSFKVKRSTCIMSYQHAGTGLVSPGECEDIVNLQGAEAYCVATHTACYVFMYVGQLSVPYGPF